MWKGLAGIYSILRRQLITWKGEQRGLTNSLVYFSFVYLNKDKLKIHLFIWTKIICSKFVIVWNNRLLCV